MPAVVRDVDDRQAVALALIENIQREDLNRSRRRKRCSACSTNTLGSTSSLRRRWAVADRRHQSAALAQLAPAVQTLLIEGELDMGHARALLSLPPAEQERAARRVAARGLSVRQTEALVKRLLSGAPALARNDPDTTRLERRLSDHLGVRTSIAGGKGGKGRIVIRYSTLEELDGVLERLGVVERS